MLLDGGTPGAATSTTPLTWPTAGLSETGLHTIAVKVTDNAGSTFTTQIVSETVDNTPPTVL